MLCIGQHITAAQNKGCKCIGFEISPDRIKEAVNNVREKGVEDLVQIMDKDIFTIDLSSANVITLYLLPKLHVRLIRQLEKLQPGSRIVSHDFAMKGIKPDQIISMISKEDGVEHTIYLWTTPLKKESKD